MIRPATMADLPRVLEIEALSFPLPWTETHFASALKNLFLVHQEDRITGFLVALADAATRGATILKVAVHPEARRRGVGTRLMRAALARFRELGLRRVELDVKIIRPEALKFYEKFGFQTVRVIPGDPEDDDDALAFYGLRLELTPA